jgi:hypothetical protein
VSACNCQGAAESNDEVHTVTPTGGHTFCCHFRKLDLRWLQQAELTPDQPPVIEFTKMATEGVADARSASRHRIYENGN